MCISTESTSKILAIKPAFNYGNGTGMAIFDADAQQLESCGLLFASCERELADKTRKFWDNEIGSDRQPKILYIECQTQSFDQATAYRTTIFSGVFIALLEEEFSPEITVRSTQRVLRNLDLLCTESKKILSSKLLSLPKHHHRPILDVVAMGISIINKEKEVTQFKPEILTATHNTQLRYNAVHYDHLTLNEDQFTQIQSC